MTDVRPLVRALLALALVFAAPAPARALEADPGASTFESQRRSYPPRRPVALEAIPVPRVEVKQPPPAPAAEADAGPRFAIERFEVVGATLLTRSQLQAALTPFRGPERTLADVEQARDAVQALYAAEGLLTVAVTIPQQTVASGTVRLEVVEARVGAVRVRNDGIPWFGEGGIRRATSEIAPGAILREEDLVAALERANRNPDLRVQPLLERSAEPGLVDVVLVADDRVPLHGSVEVNNDHTPGSPKLRLNAALSYTNLWGLGHEAGVRYQTVPNPAEFSDVQVWAGTYRAPMPWNAEQSLFYYIARSDSTNAAVGSPGLDLLGEGLNMGLRYNLPLPAPAAWEGFRHSLTFGIDRKDVTNTVSAATAQIETPILYVPLSVEWDGSLARDQALSAARFGVSFNRAGTLGGDDSKQFQVNRGGVDGDSDVDGNYVIYTLGLDHTQRLPGLLKTLAEGRFVDLPAPERSFLEDWTLGFVARAQASNQPLISTEQFSAGGVDSVRGYLDSELFGDWGYSVQTEIRTPFFRGPIGGRLQERVQLLAFWDYALLRTLEDPVVTTTNQEHLQSIGIGLRASFFERMRAELLLGNALRETESTHEPRVHFRVGVGF